MEKSNSKSASPTFKKTCPSNILLPRFLKFFRFPPFGEVFKIYFPSFKKKGGSKLCDAINSFIMEVSIIKKPVHWFEEHCFANQWTGLYLIDDSVMKELRQYYIERCGTIVNYARKSSFLLSCTTFHWE